MITCLRQETLSTHSSSQRNVIYSHFFAQKRYQPAGSVITFLRREIVRPITDINAALVWTAGVAWECGIDVEHGGIYPTPMPPKPKPHAAHAAHHAHHPHQRPLFCIMSRWAGNASIDPIKSMIPTLHGIHHHFPWVCLKATTINKGLKMEQPHVRARVERERERERET